MQNKTTSDNNLTIVQSTIHVTGGQANFVCRLKDFQFPKRQFKHKHLLSSELAQHHHCVAEGWQQPQVLGALPCLCDQQSQRQHPEWVTLVTDLLQIFVRSGIMKLCVFKLL